MHERTISRWWKVGAYTATLVARRPQQGRMDTALIEWDPGQPERLSEAELAEYIRGRNAALAEVAAEMGVRTVVIDV